MGQLSENFIATAKQKNIDYQLTIQLPENLAMELDTKKVAQLINNLLSNAFKFTPNGGQIWLKAVEREGCLQLSVEDKGRGIHPDDLPHIFNRFYQSSRPNAPKEGGTGIGLSLAQEFAKLMNGKLWAMSTLGKGSTFFFEMPIVLPSLSLTTSKSSDLDLTEAAVVSFIPKEEKILTNIPTDTPILLVEDNEYLRTYIQIILGNRYNLTIAENGKIAWELLTNQQPATSNQPPALIISDIMMPEMDGYQLLKKLKSDDRFRALPIIMLTVLAELKDKLRALRIGVDDYMTKPFEEEELIARIDNLLRNSQIRQTFYQEQHEGTKGNSNQPTKLADKVTILLSQEDAQWLVDLEKTVKAEMGNFEFKVERLAKRCLMSRRKLERKLKSLTGLSPGQYIQEMRFTEARYLLETQSAKSVKAVIYQIGIKDATNFSRTFKKRFGRVPSSYFS